MPKNDPINDRYNPPGLTSADFERFTFGEIEVDELFWQTNRPKETDPWRKVSQTEGMNLKTRSTHNFEMKTKVYQKI